MDLLRRFEIAQYMRQEWADFREFAAAGMVFLGFEITEVQTDIAHFMDVGPRLSMVMAQRGEAKSTLAALKAVHSLVMDPKTRVLIVSAGEDKANEVASVVIKLILHWDILEYLRPDRKMGDRTAADEFDVHYSLKGIDQSPSVACIGITSNLQGRRADLLVPDDIESTKNGLTVTQRSQLLALTREFTSINTHGKILYLGTPQTKDSVYNTLPGRGFTVRIWPGRYPNDDEIERYGDRLAPIIREAIERDPSVQSGGGIDGTRGKPTDPLRFNEDALVEKELDQGPEGFQLQYMLDTSLMDAMRQQLKLSDLLVANFDNDRLPELLVWQAAPKYLVELDGEFPVPLTRMYHPVPVDNVAFKPRGETIMFIDPAGGGADEIGYAVSTAMGPYIHVLDVGGIRGGLTDENADLIVDIIAEFDVSHVQVESNMGHGLFEINLRGHLVRRKITDVGVKGEYSTGQKERRIIDSLVSAMQRHKVVIHQRVFESDKRWNKQHSQEKRIQRSLFYQISNITTDRDSLPHDDRIEAFAGSVRWHKNVLVQDEEAAAKARREAEARDYMENPMGYDDPSFQQQNSRARGTLGRIHNRRR